MPIARSVRCAGASAPCSWGRAGGASDRHRQSGLGRRIQRTGGNKLVKHATRAAARRRHQLFFGRGNRAKRAHPSIHPFRLHAPVVCVRRRRAKRRRPRSVTYKREGIQSWKRAAGFRIRTFSPACRFPGSPIAVTNSDWGFAQCKLASGQVIVGVVA